MIFNEAKNQSSEDPMTFLKNRKSGAQESAKKAKEKGGDAMLSYYHFAAKDQPYTEVIRTLREQGLKPAIDLCKRNYKDLKSQVDLDMSQKDYQDIVGKIEVYGECYIKFKGLI
jgi:hypothetical protein